jgi:hypothetical protein
MASLLRLRNSLQNFIFSRLHGSLQRRSYLLASLSLLQNALFLQLHHEGLLEK